MFEKMAGIEERYAAAQGRLETPEVYSDPAAYAALAREVKELTPVVEAYRRWKGLRRDLEEARELLSDPELGAMAREEMESAKAGIDAAERELKLLLLMQYCITGRTQTTGGTS